MNLILVFAEDFVDSHKVRLTGRRHRHVAKVLRAGIGTEVCVGQQNGLIGRGRITACDDSSLEMQVRLDQQPPDPLPVTLLLALPRPKVLRRTMQAATAMGVKRIVILSTWRVEKSFWSSPFLTDAALREQMLLGLEQGGDTVLPEVMKRNLFKPFVEDDLPHLASGSLKLVAHPTAEAECPRAVGSPVTLAIGPEGGFIPYEIDLLAECGFTAVSLGPRRLRVEHALPALLARLF